LKQNKSTDPKEGKKKIFVKTPYGRKLYESLNDIFKGKSFRKKWEAQQKIDQYKKEFIDKIQKNRKFPPDTYRFFNEDCKKFNLFIPNFSIYGQIKDH